MTHRDQASFIPNEKLPLITNAVLEACDSPDGVKDGVLVHEPLWNATAGAASNQATHQIVLGDTYTVSPTLIVEGRFSFSCAYYVDNPPSVGLDLSVYIPARSSCLEESVEIESDAPGEVFPRLDFHVDESFGTQRRPDRPE